MNMPGWISIFLCLQCLVKKEKPQNKNLKSLFGLNLTTWFIYKHSHNTYMTKNCLPHSKISSLSQHTIDLRIISHNRQPLNKFLQIKLNYMCVKDRTLQNCLVFNLAIPDKFGDKFSRLIMTYPSWLWTSL